MSFPPSLADPCTGEPASLLCVASDNRGLPGLFPYYRSASGHLFLGEVPENLGDYYVGGYQKIPQGEAELAAMARKDAYRLDGIRPHVASGDFLEIGPWIGLVAYSAKQAGYRVHVLEREQRCVDLLNGVGINAMQTNDPARSLQDNPTTYDVIGMWHSIEHFPRPWEVIAAAAERLRPGGLLVIAAPNPESAQMRVLGKRWVHLDAPRHLHFLTAAMIAGIGRDKGLEVVDCTTDDELGRRCDIDGWDREAQRQARFIPIVRGVWRRLIVPRLRRHRQPGAFDGASFTIMMRKPA